MRKYHARQLESLQSTLETEMKAKSDLVTISTPLISILNNFDYGFLFLFCCCCFFVLKRKYKARENLQNLSSYEHRVTVGEPTANIFP